MDVPSHLEYRLVSRLWNEVMSTQAAFMHSDIVAIFDGPHLANKGEAYFAIQHSGSRPLNIKIVDPQQYTDAALPTSPDAVALVAQLQGRARSLVVPACSVFMRFLLEPWTSLNSIVLDGRGGDQSLPIRHIWTLGIWTSPCLTSIRLLGLNPVPHVKDSFPFHLVKHITVSCTTKNLAHGVSFFPNLDRLDAIVTQSYPQPFVILGPKVHFARFLVYGGQVNFEDLEMAAIQELHIYCKTSIYFDGLCKAKFPHLHTFVFAVPNTTSSSLDLAPLFDALSDLTALTYFGLFQVLVKGQDACNNQQCQNRHLSGHHFTNFRHATLTHVRISNTSLDQVILQAMLLNLPKLGKLTVVQAKCATPITVVPKLGTRVRIRTTADVKECLIVKE